MLWKLFGLQKILDALFDDNWVCLGLPDNLNYDYETSEQFLQV